MEPRKPPTFLPKIQKKNQGKFPNDSSAKINVQPKQKTPQASLAKGQGSRSSSRNKLAEEEKYNGKKNANARMPVHERLYAQSKRLPTKHELARLSALFLSLSSITLALIFEFAISSRSDFFEVLITCKRFHYILTNDYDLLLQCTKLFAVSQKSQGLKAKIDKIPEGNHEELVKTLQEESKKASNKTSSKFIDLFSRLCNYNATKENLPNKILKEIDLSVSVAINQKHVFKNVKFMQLFQNFGTYIFLRIDQTAQVSMENEGQLEIVLTFMSQKFGIQKEVKSNKITREILSSMCKRTRVFNYLVTQNFVFVSFDEDQVLYAIAEINAFSILLPMSRQILSKYKNNPNIAKKIKQLDFQYDSLREYFGCETDLEIIVSLHNMKSRVYYYINPRTFPKEVSREAAIWVFELRERLDCQRFELVLDTQLGIREKIPSTILCDFILKDRDMFLVNDSTFCEITSLENFRDFPDYFEIDPLENKPMEIRVTGGGERKSEKKWELAIYLQEDLREKTIYVRKIEILITPNILKR